MDNDLISLLYIHDPEISESGLKFLKSDGFVFEICRQNQMDSFKSRLNLPDLILIDYSINISRILKQTIHSFVKSDGQIKPAVFLVLTTYPDAEKRLKLMDQGCDDFLIRPFHTKEIKKKFDIYHRFKHLSQQNSIQNKKLEKTFTYLDKFKKELKITKTELFEERTSLNNVLKQVNQMTLERNRIKKDIKILKKRLFENMEGFGHLLSSLIQTRIEKNRGHGERVAHIAQYIGRQLKLSEKKLADLSKAAMLHETGLLFVPELIVRKSEDQVSDYEKDYFLHSSVKGADLLSNCTEFDNCAEIIRNLNENSDGTGHPQGLKRRFIPLLSRILAGADVFDTLKDEKDVSSLEILLEKLEVFSGTRLDPAIVALLEKYAILHMGTDSYRVKGIGIHQLEPGMALGTGLFTNTGTKLFSVNTLLTREAIDKIKNYNREYPVDEIVYIRT